MKRTFTLLFLTLIALGISAQKMKTLDGSYMGLFASTDGKYVCGDSQMGVAFIWNVENNTVTTDAEYENESSATGISNDGTAVGYWGDYAAKYTPEGKFIKLDGEDSEEMSIASRITPDGSVIVGCNMTASYVQHACVWENGKKTMLPEPTAEEVGFPVFGTNAIDVSNDGSIIVGTILDRYNYLPLIYWTKEADGTYKLHTPCADLFEPDYGDKPYFYISPVNISGNGKWISLLLQRNGDALPVEMGRMNVETGQIDIAGISADGNIEVEKSLISASVANDGTMIGMTEPLRGETMIGRIALIWEIGEKNVRTLSEAYPTLTRLSDYEAFASTVSHITPDGRFIVGFGITDEGTYETFIIDRNATSSDFIGSATTDKAGTTTAIYGIDGKLVHTANSNNLEKGVYIIKSGNGKDMKTKKVVVK